MAGIEEQAQKRFERIVEQMAESEGITEQFKATDLVAWVVEIPTFGFSLKSQL